MSLRTNFLATALMAGTAFAAMAQTNAPAPLAPNETNQSAPKAQPQSTMPSTTAPGITGSTGTAGEAFLPSSATLAKGHWSTSEAKGMAVYNRQNEKLGDVQDVLIDTDGRVLAAVIGVGGFLGMGEKSVAVTYRAFQMTHDTNGRAKLIVDTDKATLKAAPEYRPQRS